MVASGEQWVGRARPGLTTLGGKQTKMLRCGEVRALALLQAGETQSNLCNVIARASDVHDVPGPHVILRLACSGFWGPEIMD